ncbi:F-box/FBD/LRR-repeat protein At1g13570 [Capsicum annuum]|uniref:F-box/FBD/LRR-repeat protein At1g13570 n=1 Tax=Capsicum annuum TaxID=4072 RepID=UPI001FB08CF8|nr:F-box/FBD/LRR-repeat protein At1g13570 [Capsicum annuum]
MTKGGKRVAVKGESKDRISGLPRNVIDRILELLQVHDAARTSILSRMWRYNWASLPNLVLNHHFNRSFKKESHYNFKEVVDDILLLHIGDIVKFVLDTRGARMPSHAVIDKWMLYVTRNGVKDLTLRISDNDTYTLPSSVFNCSTLTKLKLFKCVFKPPNPFLGFLNLTTLHLKGTTFVPATLYCVIKAPLLVNLSLDLCRGTQYLNIVSPGLKRLYVADSHSYLVLDCFMNCTNLRLLGLKFNGVVDNPTNDKISTLAKLLVSSTALEVLSLDSFFVELLSVDVVLNGIPFTLNCLWRLLLDIDFSKMGLISRTLQLIKNSPNLSELGICVHATSDNAEAILKYLDTPSYLERPLDKLEYVVINDFQNSEVELLFVKLLLSLTPSLLRMCIAQQTDIDIDVALELMRFPRVSPRAELFYSQRTFFDFGCVDL